MISPAVPSRRVRALVVGEALMDVVTSVEGSREHPGGSPMNVSFGLARLSVDVVFLTRLGDDERGRVIADHLNSAGVAIAPGLTRDATTSSATATIGSDGAATYRFDVEWSLPADAVELGGFDLVHFGSIGAFLQPGTEVVASLVRDAREVATISYDPNIRPQFLPDHAAAVAATERHVDSCDVVKASDEDLAWLYPGEDFGVVAARWLATGPALVVVTSGSGGSIAAFRSGQVHVPARTVEVADTIGAGDAFMAGLIAGLATAGLVGAARREALRSIDADTVTRLIERATLSAAITVSRHGANPPTLAEVDSGTLV